jgi:hypothetical protein
MRKPARGGLSLFGVVVLDACNECVEQLDELCGGLPVRRGRAKSRTTV